MSSRVEERGRHPKPALPGILPPGRFVTAAVGDFKFRLSQIAPAKALRPRRRGAAASVAAQPQNRGAPFESPSSQAPSLELGIVELDPTTGPVAS